MDHLSQVDTGVWIVWSLCFLIFSLISFLDKSLFGTLRQTNYLTYVRLLFNQSMASITQSPTNRLKCALVLRPDRTSLEFDYWSHLSLRLQLCIFRLFCQRLNQCQYNCGQKFRRNQLIGRHHQNWKSSSFDLQDIASRKCYGIEQRPRQTI